MMKTEVKTSTELDNCKIEALHSYVIYILKNRGSSWTHESLLEILIDNIQTNIANKRNDLVDDLFFAIKNDNDTKETLSIFAINLYKVVDSVKERSWATQLKVTKGSLCFTFCFSTDTDLEHYLNLLRNKNKDFKRSISDVILNETLLGVFQVNSKCVSWDISEVTVIKGL